MSNLDKTALVFAITRTFHGHRDYTWPSRYTSTTLARADITPRFAQGQSLAITIDGGMFVPCDMDIKLTTNDNGTVTIYSRAMRCEYVVNKVNLKVELYRLIEEYQDIREAEMKHY